MNGTSATRAWPGIRRVRKTLVPWVLCAALLMAACDGGGSDAKGASASPKDTTCDGRIDGTAHITVWYHAGPSGEFTTLQSQVKEFNKQQDKVRVELVTLPEERAYTALVLSAAAGGDRVSAGTGCRPTTPRRA
nr:hypothetical protein OG999_40285 [Streptomyces sp. NBC_00886]